MSNQSGKEPHDIFEARKLVYGHCGDMHKFVITWRERLLAGYATVLAALSIAYSWAYNSDSSTYFSTAICGAGILLTVFFWLLDRRTRDLYRTCIEIGFNIEKKLGIVDHDKGQVGLYSGLRLSLKELKTLNTDDASQSQDTVQLLPRVIRRVWHWVKSHSGAIDILAFVAVVGMIILLACPPRHSSDKQAASTAIQAEGRNDSNGGPSSSSPSQPGKTTESKGGSQ